MLYGLYAPRVIVTLCLKLFSHGLSPFRSDPPSVGGVSMAYEIHACHSGSIWAL